ncbi:hypothetical protein ERJ75_000209700 [Trypanosoma vivax]|uniref:LisH domain-containing protein n=1 Tax=Trypanosoma vivax (strain Y486) TaxID=1055687 RepID=G0U9Z5_TRYVY|nr:hypothetical protein ERJ75_000209700 [Trypanosoma vivax]CCC52626.1 conserved hypothetical protein [Trypanosoma vivax Y486]
MADGVVAHEAVLHHIYAFLRAYGYKNTLLALQCESRVPYNTIDVVEARDNGGVEISSVALARAVLDGIWDTVLSTYVDSLLLPDEVVFSIYELIFEELLVLRGFVHAARALFVNSPVFHRMKRSSAARHARLQEMLDSNKHSVADGPERLEQEVVPESFKQKREDILKVLQEAITWNAEPYGGFLPASLWRAQNGGEMHNSHTALLKRPRMEETSDTVVETGDIVTSVCSRSGEHQPPGTDRSMAFLQYPLECPKRVLKKVGFASAVTPAACLVASLPKEGTPPTRFTALIVGKTDGTVDFLDSECAQPVGCSAGHTDSVLCAALDVVTDGITWVAVGYRDGWVKVYNAESRKLVRRFPQVHSSGVTTLTFAGERSTALSGHHTYIVSGSYDGTIHLLNISEGKSTQRIVDAHQLKYVLSLCVVPLKEEVPQHIASAGNNGTLCFWRLSAGALQQVGGPRTLQTVHSSLKEDIPTRLLPVDDENASGEFVVITRGSRVVLVSIRFTNDATEPHVVLVRCMICASEAIHGGCLRVVQTRTQTQPVLSIFLTDRTGTILLYNVGMHWRTQMDAGAALFHKAVDETTVVSADLGKVVGDLNVVGVGEKFDRLLAYSPSLAVMYILAWE